MSEDKENTGDEAALTKPPVETKPTEPPKKAKVEEPAEEIIPWENVKFQDIDMNKFKELLVNAGIKTYQDALKNRNVIYGILQRLYGVDCAILVAFAREHQEK